jgi:alkylhydroperoxidase/carboxymuconolactone decarboxylase family protein YurZ
VLQLGKDPLRLAALYGTSGHATGALAIGLTPRQARSLRGLVATPADWAQARARLAEAVDA